ncbi:MAG TPA: hypothetical protein ENI07_10055 [Desulfobacterales bacterium]|nr:hypothetical protein [Desulfobacterales bacterium]
MTPQPKKKRIRLKGKAYTEFKRLIYHKAEGKCFICGVIKPITINGVFNEYLCAHVYHIKSRGSGGEDTEENCRISCFDCHRTDHDGCLCEYVKCQRYYNKDCLVHRT